MEHVRMRLQYIGDVGVRMHHLVWSSWQFNWCRSRRTLWHHQSNHQWDNSITTEDNGTWNSAETHKKEGYLPRRWWWPKLRRRKIWQWFLQSFRRIATGGRGVLCERPVRIPYCHRISGWEGVETRIWTREVSRAPWVPLETTVAREP